MPGIIKGALHVLVVGFGKQIFFSVCFEYINCFAFLDTDGKSILEFGTIYTE